MWRLRRLKKAVQTELCTDTFDPKHPAFDEQWGFIMFHSYLRSEPEEARKKISASRQNQLSGTKVPAF
jgi:hypothetical protein